MKTAVIAFGGNALIRESQKGTFQEQINNVSIACEHIISLVNKGYRIAITHGNGPQVGAILSQQERSSKFIPKMPLFVCVAESQGMIGYMLGKSLYNKIHSAKLNIPVITLLTHVLVDRKDRAFNKPTKRIGIEGSPGSRLVPSPEPKKIIEGPVIRELVKKHIVISCGGGGIPVIKEKGLKGIDAVIDKDLASQKLAETIGADLLIILTDVDCVYLNYKKKNQKELRELSLGQAKKLLLEGQFSAGSMGPKILASIRFLNHNPKGKVMITSLVHLENALEVKKGTIITS